ncbi:MAG: prefoldin subunit beta [Candidatus Diapherotrites archaeon]
MAELDQSKVNEFRAGRQQLLNVSAQKQQFQLQASAVQSALNEIRETKPKTVFKAVGNILIEKDAKTVEKELLEAKETLDLRIDTLQKQEDSLVNRLNKIKASIEEGAGESSVSVPEPEVKEAKGKKKTSKK